MKVTIESEDPKEINRLTKSLDMASVLFEITRNLHRRFENDEDCNYEEVFDAIYEILSDHGINIDDLIE